MPKLVIALAIAVVGTGPVVASQKIWLDGVTLFAVSKTNDKQRKEIL